MRSDGFPEGALDCIAGDALLDGVCAEAAAAICSGALGSCTTGMYPGRTSVLSLRSLPTNPPYNVATTFCDKFFFSISCVPTKRASSRSIVCLSCWVT